ncbi:DMT family transporter [Marinobacterium lutimaris]|uniref:Permease of the drug/metabolite transporter (DMT) superfamily n=1 Tax=Marinobacterium lutimaris TaxID=568106 RepID=A0A1H5X9H3_9GAMM|nr:DMT family transporter [Marinobacterium lutimaris]SEG07886.1 Permease of the drug/metabolite transporter (DMT) superfamily [Marinobacterium lutimaris]
MTSSRLWPAVVLLLITTWSWGGMFPVAKPMLDILDPFFMTLIRFSLTALGLLLILFCVEGRKAFNFEGRLLRLLFLGTLGFACFNLLAFNGLVHSKPEHGAVIMATQPMIAVLLTWVMRGLKPGAFTLGTILVAFAGVFLVITGGDIERAFGGGKIIWDLLFFTGATFWVAYTLGAQSFHSWSPLRYTAITAGLGCLSIALVSFGLTAVDMLSIPEWNTLVELRWSLAYLVIPAGIMGVLFWNMGIKKLGPINGVLFINFVPVSAFTIGAIQGHKITPTEVIGAAMVMTALIANNLYVRSRMKRSQGSNRDSEQNDELPLRPVTAKPDNA